MRYKWISVGVALLLAATLTTVLRLSVAAGADAPSAWRLVGQIGGPTQAVAVQGDYAYVGVGLRLIVLDISDPAALSEVGSTAPFPYFVEDIAVNGTLAYVAAGAAGLRIVDVSNAAQPAELGAWDSPGYAEGLDVAGNIVYLADGPYGLRSVDVSDSARPVPLGAAYDMNYAYEVVVSGDYAYIAAAGAGVLVVDVSNPARPEEMGALDTPGYAYGVAVSATLAYVADAWEGLQVVDVANPLSPILMGACDTPGWALNVAVAGTVAYVADGASGLRVLDVSTAAQPRQLGAFEPSGLARRVAVTAEAVFVADQRGGLRAIDMSAPSHPVQRGLYACLAEARRLVVAGPLAYVAAGTGGMRIIDWSDPTRPYEIGSYDTGGGYCNSVVVTGTLACVDTYMSGSSGIHMVDTTDPRQPLRVGVALFPPTDYRHLAVRGNILYAVDEAGLRLIDISNPALPASLGHVRTDQDNEGSLEVALSGSLAFLAVAKSGMVIIDVSDPHNPKPVGGYDTDRFAHGVAAGGDRAYVLYGEDGVDIVQVLPEPPDSVPVTELAHWETPGCATSLSLDGSLACVGDGGGGVQVVDVSDPRRPVVLASIDTPGQAWQAVASGDYLLVADGEGGLLVLERVRRRGAWLSDLAYRRPGETDHGVAHVSGRRTVTSTPSYGGLPGAESRGAGAQSHSASAGLQIVTSVQDSGQGTLRAALSSASAGDTILFDPLAFPPARPITIALVSPLPAITQGNLTLDASNAGVILDGSLLSGQVHGLLLHSNGNIVRGLQVVRFPLNGIELVDSRDNVIGGDRALGSGPLGQGNLLSDNSGGLGLHGSSTTGNVILGNLIGTDVSGRVARSNMIGIQLQDGAHHNRIGGTAPGQGNLISGNWSRGVQLVGEGVSGNVVVGNRIGTDLGGTLPLPNYFGIIAEAGATGNVIGGRTPGEANVISGNRPYGVVLSDPGTSHNLVIGNLIGTDATGTVALPNLGGVSICGTSGYNRVGGTATGEGNVISGNEGGGISLTGDELVGNLILGNRIGADITGVRSLGNGVGVSLDAATRHNVIGGFTASETNVIGANGTGIALRNAGVEDTFILGNEIGKGRPGTIYLGNSGDGVLLQDYARRTFVQGNTIAFSGQAGLAVILGRQNTARRNGIYANGGPGITLQQEGNSLLAAPVLARSTPAIVSGTACPGCTVEVFSDSEDEGRIYEGTVIADSIGHWQLVTGNALSGPFITATATDPDGNTSEFSAPVRLVAGRVCLPLLMK